MAPGVVDLNFLLKLDGWLFTSSYILHILDGVRHGYGTYFSSCSRASAICHWACVVASTCVLLNHSIILWLFASWTCLIEHKESEEEERGVCLLNCVHIRNDMYIYLFIDCVRVSISFCVCIVHVRMCKMESCITSLTVGVSSPA